MTSTKIHCINGGRGSRDYDGLLTLLLTSVLHRPPQIHELRTREAQAPQKRGREGTGKKDKERPTLARQKQTHGVDIKEQVRAHLKRELAKKKNKEPPSRSALYLEAVRQA